MKLFLRRSQRTGGILSGGNIVFGVDARIEPTEAEKSLVIKYRLGPAVVYDSEAKKSLGAAAEANREKGGLMGMAKAAVLSGLAALSLRCTIDSLTKGQHIECRDLNEMLGAEQAIVEACRTAKSFLDVASTFDGREEVMEF